ncbi:unnamed protein product [Arabidopsis arenosa]|uniref:RNase H type-1 domain-containing protein n=1 Tax=Arabidopsis arenosa TaxID=38785 RepID=A0A8S1ZXP2_ARAAE|nr:unnamed protein product [Arabidopsis arenosa]
MTPNLTRGTSINQSNTLAKIVESKQAEALRKDKRNTTRSSTYIRRAEVNRAFELDIQKAPPPRRRSKDRTDYRQEYNRDYNKHSRGYDHEHPRDRQRHSSQDFRSGSHPSHHHDQRISSPSRSRYEEYQRHDRRYVHRRSPSGSHNYTSTQRTQRSSDLHTPPPNPIREPLLSPVQPRPQPQDSLRSNSNSRRPALERLTEIIPVEVPFQGGGGSTGSSRLQDVAILYDGESNQGNPFASFPLQSAFLSVNPDATPSNSHFPPTEVNNPPSPQQTELPQLRVPASLRLGPGRESTRTTPLATSKAKAKGPQKAKAQSTKRGPRKPAQTAAQKAASKASTSNPAPKRRVSTRAPPKPRGTNSPLVGVSLRKRNTTRATNPSRKRLCTEANSVFGTETASGEVNFAASGSNPTGIQRQEPIQDTLDFRNQLLFADKTFSDSDTIQKAIKDAIEWHNAQTRKETETSSATPVARATPLPSASMLCIETDASWLEPTRFCGLGWVGRDSQGTILFKNSATEQFVASVIQGEALAIKAGLQEATLHGFSTVAIKSDSKTLIELLRSGKVTNELVGLLHDIRGLAANLVSVTFQFIPRSANTVADEMAKSALSTLVSSSLGDSLF